MSIESRYKQRAPSRLTCPYNCMIGMALQESEPGCLIVQDIYSYIERRWPDFKLSAPKGWKNCVRHSLSSSPYFCKQKRSTFEQKGFKWQIAPGDRQKLEAEIENYKLEEEKLKLGSATSVFNGYHQRSVMLSSANQLQQHTPAQRDQLSSIAQQILTRRQHDIALTSHPNPPGTDIKLSASGADLKMKNFCQLTGVDEPSLTLQLEDFISLINDDPQPKQDKSSTSPMQNKEEGNITEVTPNEILPGSSKEHPVTIPAMEASNGKDSIHIPVDRPGRFVIGQVIPHATSGTQCAANTVAPRVMRISDIAPHLFTSTACDQSKPSVDSQKTPATVAANINEQQLIDVKSRKLAIPQYCDTDSLPPDLESLQCVINSEFSDIHIGDFLGDFCTEKFDNCFNAANTNLSTSDENTQNDNDQVNKLQELSHPTPDNSNLTSVLDALNIKFQDAHQVNDTGFEIPKVSSKTTAGMDSLPEIVLGKIWGSCMEDEGNLYELLLGSIVEVETSELSTAEDKNMIDQLDHNEPFCATHLSSTPIKITCTEKVQFKNKLKEPKNLSSLGEQSENGIQLSGENDQLFDLSTLSAVSLADKEKSELINISFIDSKLRHKADLNGFATRSPIHLDEENLLDSSALSAMLASNPNRSLREISTFEEHQLLDSSITTCGKNDCCSEGFQSRSVARKLATGLHSSAVYRNSKALLSKSSQLLIFDKEENLLPSSKLFPGLSEEEIDTALIYSSGTLDLLANTVNKEVETLDLSSFSNWWIKLQFN